MIQPVSTMAKAVHAARHLVASSPTFLERCKEHECPDPLKHVYPFEEFARNRNVRASRPFAVVGLDRMAYSEILPGCAQVNLKCEGGVIVIICDNARYNDFETTNPPHDEGDSHADFLNFFGGVLDDQDGRFAVHEHDGGVGFAFRGIEVMEVPDRVPYQDRAADDYWGAIAVFTWGVE